MKRLASTIKQYDYTSKEEFLKDVEAMRKKGYLLINDGMISKNLEPSELINSDKWKFSAYFIKSPFM